MDWRSQGARKKLRVQWYTSNPVKVLIDKYEIIETIGAGVLGTWYKIRRKDNQTLLVAKEISIQNKNNIISDLKELTVNDGCHGQFNKTEKLKEAAILSQLK